MKRAVGHQALGWAMLAALVGCEDKASKELLEVLSASDQVAIAPQVDAPATGPVAGPAKPVRARPGARLLAFRRGWVEWLHPATGETEIRFLNAVGEPLNGVHQASLWLAGPDGPREVALVSGSIEGTMRPVEPVTEALPQGVLRFALGDEIHRVALPIAAASEPPASAPANRS